MLLSAVSVLVVAQSNSEIPEGLMNNPVYKLSVAYATSMDKVTQQCMDFNLMIYKKSEQAQMRFLSPFLG